MGMGKDIETHKLLFRSDELKPERQEKRQEVYLRMPAVLPPDTISIFD